MSVAVTIDQVFHRYGDHAALQGLSLAIPAGEIYALLGPNGSGKTTLFRLICTLLKLQSGTIVLAGVDVRSQPQEARKRFGMVFQTASLDKKLTVGENLRCQAALYGLRGQTYRKRCDRLLDQLGLAERVNERCEKLSGGFRRRVELAKGMLHQPEVLLLDEPSVGLDPSARLELWEALRVLSAAGTTVVMTTHLMDEAEKADRIAILDSGKCIAEGAPEELRSQLGAGQITIVSKDPARTVSWIEQGLALKTMTLANQIRIETDRTVDVLPHLAERLGDDVLSLTVGRPSLEDLFIARTGKRFDDSEGQRGAKR